MKAKFLFAVLFISLSSVAQQQTWQWGYDGGGAGNDQALSISTDRSGFSYVTGYFYSTANFGAYSLTSAGDKDIFVAKYTSGGVCIWAKRHGSAAADQGYGIDIDTLGNCYVTGNAGSSIFTAKYDTNGNLVWDDSIHTQGSPAARGISTDADGNSWIAGNFSGTAVFGSFTLSGGGFIAKYDPNGNVIFAKIVGGIVEYGVTHDAAGNSYVIGDLQGTRSVGTQTTTANGMQDMILVKTDTAGNFVWFQQSACSSAATTGVTGICCDGQNGIYVCGFTDGSTIFGGDTLHISQAILPRDIYLVKYDTSGGELWLQQSAWVNWAASGQLEAFSLTADQNANIYMTGAFVDDITFGNTVLADNNNGVNTYIAMFDHATGNCQFAIPSTGQNPGAYGCGISTDELGGTYIVGFDKAPVVFGAYSTQLIGGEDMFIAKIMAGKETGIEEYAAKDNALLYNAGENFHLSIADFSAAKKTTFSLYDGVGRLILQKQIENGETDIETENLARGIYYWRLEGEKFSSGKILK